MMARWGPLAAFLLIALVGGLVIEHSTKQTAELLRDSQVRSCERDNRFRAKVGEANEGFHLHNDITADLFTNIAKAAPDRATKEAFRKAVPVYEHVKTFYTPLPQTNCQRAFPKP